MVSYSPRSPAVYSVYPPCSEPLQQKAQTYGIETRCPVSPHGHTGLVHALEAVGGVDVLLYLAAKVIFVL